MIILLKVFKNIVKFAFIFFASYAFCAEIRVPRDYSKIQQAIDAAADFDSIIIEAGRYKESLLIRNKSLTIIGDSAFDALAGNGGTILDGGGTNQVIYSNSKQLDLSNIQITNGNSGVGGLFNYENGNLHLKNCSFLNNVGSGDITGAAMRLSGATVKIEHCRFSGNNAKKAGSLIDWCSSVVVSGSLFESNVADGAAFMLNGSTPHFEVLNCLLVNNSGPLFADMVGWWSFGNKRIFKNITAFGGGVFLKVLMYDSDGATPIASEGREISNVIISGGLGLLQTERISGAYREVGISVKNILFGAGSGFGDSGILKIYSTNVSHLDPKFVSPSTGDFHLQDISPAINAGENTLINDPTATDLDGRKRVLGGNVDLGAYERWTFYPTNSFNMDEGVVWGTDANQQDIAFFGGIQFKLESGPEGLAVDPSTGRLSWTPSEAQGPGTYLAKIRGTAVSTPSATDTQTVTLKVAEVNLPPNISAGTTQSVVERNLWSIALAASDPDLPLNPLSYRMVSGPAGVSVDGKSGFVSWSPGEADGGKGYDMVFEVSDNGVPPLVAQTTVHLDVAKVNDPPLLRAINDLSIPEMQLWTMRADGQDIDLPPQTVTYSLPLAPDGMVIDSGTGVMSWTPTEAQGPGIYPVTVRVTDPFGLWAEQRFSVTVTEVNTPPVLSGSSDQYLVYGQALSLQLATFDGDLPKNKLTYSLLSGPSNAVFSSSGLLSWNPTRNQSPSTNVFVVSLSDGLATVTNRFSVEVLDLITTLGGKEATNSQGALPGTMMGFLNSKTNWLVFYTLDGSQPDASSTYFLDAFELLKSSTVWPIAYSPDFSQAVLGIPVKINLLKPQLISLSGGTGLTFQGSPVPVAATSSSGLPVVVSVVSGPAHLDNGMLVADGGGSVKIRATQVGDETWAPASVDASLVINPATQTLNWGNLPTLVYGMPPISMAAKASSGLAVSYTLISGPASLSGNVLTLTGAGTVVLQAKQAGNADFAAGQWNASYEIEKTPQTITFESIGDQSFSAAPIVLGAFASSGLPVSYEIVVGPATVSGDRLILNGVGLVKVKASQSGNSNYLPAVSKEQSFTVSKGKQVVSFAEISQQTFGSAPVQLTATASSGLPIVFQVVSGPGSVNGKTLTITGAGTIVVQAFQAGDAFNLPATVSQQVMVAKGSQSISFADLATIGYSTNSISLTAVANSGLSVGFRIISGPGKISGNSLTLTGVGIIAIAADQTGNDNYLAASSVTNKLVVTRGPQSISFNTIPDQLVSNQTIQLSAASSAGLPVAYTVLSGPATISGNILKMLNGGQVTVRALNPGSPLYLAAQADQSFIAGPMINNPIAVSPDGSFTLQVRAPSGADVLVEGASDLTNWNIVQHLNGQGLGNSVGVTVKPSVGNRTQFWRVRIQ